MPVSRLQIFQGPCQVQFAGSVFYSKDNVICALNVKEGEIISDAIGLVDYRDDDVMATITFTPDGQTTNTLLSVLFPFIQAGFLPGQSIFGNADQPLVIWTRDGYKHTFYNAAVTKQPSFAASAIKTPFGSMTFRAIRPLGAAWSGTGTQGIAAIAAANYPGDATYNVSEIITTPFAAKWFNGVVPFGTVTGSGATPDVFTTAPGGGTASPVIGDTIIQSGFADAALNGMFTVATVPGAGEYTLYTYGTTNPVAGSGGAEAGGSYVRNNDFDSFTTESGWMIDTNVSLSDVGTDDLGVIDLRFDKIEVTAKAIPVGPHPSAVLAALGIQGTGAIRGRSRANAGANLYLSGAGLYAKLTQASLVDIKPVQAGAKVKRIGECSWKTTMTLAAGVPNPPLSLSTNAIA
jgi:hypothetical protein